VIDNHNNVVVGVVGEGGHILNDNGRDFPGFVVSKRRSQFKIQLKGLGSGNFKNRPSRPIVIASPHWYTQGKTAYPVNIAQISLAVEASSDEDDVFTVRVGSYSTTGNQVGMNFIALDPTFEDDSFVFGYVDSSENGTDAQGKWKSHRRSDSVPVSPLLQTELCGILGKTTSCPILIDTTPSDSYSGVEIKFAKSFVALPAVIITPVVNATNPECGTNKDGFEWTNVDINVPQCIVETIGQDSIFVKCGCVMIKYPGQSNAFITYKGLPFNFLAVGPTETVETDRTNGEPCTSYSDCAKGHICLETKQVCSDGLKSSPCESSKSCYSEFGCDLLKTQTCVDSCSSDSDCDLPLNRGRFCYTAGDPDVRGVCVGKVWTGGDCSDEIPCSKDLQCYSGKCFVRKGDRNIGDTCEEPSDCKSEKCWRELCISTEEVLQR